MDDKQYEIILHHADCCIGDLQDNEEYEMCAAILKDAKRDLAAMRQPITAEALLAAGWKWDPQDREYTLTIPQKWTFFYNVEYSVLQVHCWDTESSVTVRTMSNMYDLGELVRLLGGAA